MLGFLPLSSAPISTIGLAFSLSLTAAQGTFSLTAPTTTLKVTRNIQMVAAKGSFTLGGLPVTFPVAKAPLSAAKGTFTLAGQSTAFGHGYAFSTAKGTFSLTGNAASLRAAHLVIADLGNFALVGNPAAVQVARKVTAASGTFTLAGQSTAFDRGYAFTTATGTFALTGRSAGTVVSRKVTAAKGTFAITAPTTALNKGKTLYGNKGIFALTSGTTALVWQEGQVGKNQVNQLPSPVNTTGSVDSNTVRSNDNIIASKFSAHDADSALHVQSGLLAYRPAVLAEGSMYVGTDTGDIYFYTGGTWITISSARCHGAFQDTTTQSVPAINTATIITFNQTDVSNGVSLVSGSRLTAQRSGVHNLQWSGQFVNADTQIQDVDVWVRINGTDLVGSNGRVSVPNKHGGVNGSVLPAWNYFLSLSAGDYVQLVWASTSTSVTLAYLAADTGVPHPSTASVIATLNRM